MKNFDEAIAPYVQKITSEDNLQVVKYVYCHKGRHYNIDRFNYKEPVKRNVSRTKQRNLRTPKGLFKNVQAAAIAEGVTTASIYHKLKKQPKEYYDEIQT